MPPIECQSHVDEMKRARRQRGFAQQDPVWSRVVRGVRTSQPSFSQHHIRFRLVVTYANFSISVTMAAVSASSQLVRALLGTASALDQVNLLNAAFHIFRPKNWNEIKASGLIDLLLKLSATADRPGAGVSSNPLHNKLNSLPHPSFIIVRRGSAPHGYRTRSHGCTEMYHRRCQHTARPRGLCARFRPPYFASTEERAFDFASSYPDGRRSLYGLRFLVQRLQAPGNLQRSYPVSLVDVLHIH